MKAFCTADLTLLLTGMFDMTEIVNIPETLPLNPFPHVDDPEEQYNAAAYEVGLQLPLAIERARAIVEAGRINSVAAHEAAQAATQAKDAIEPLAHAVSEAHEDVMQAHAAVMPAAQDVQQTAEALSEALENLEAGPVASFNGRGGFVELQKSDITALVPEATEQDLQEELNEPRLVTPAQIKVVAEKAAYETAESEIGTVFYGYPPPDDGGVWLLSGNLYLSAAYPELAAILGRKIQPQSAIASTLDPTNSPSLELGGSVVAQRPVNGRWIFGATRADGGSFLSTPDLTKWSIHHPDSTAAEGTAQHITYACGDGGDVAFVATNTTNIYRTVDGMQTWQKVTLPTAINIRGLIYTGTHFIVIGNSTTHYESADNGVTWTALPVSPQGCTSADFGLGRLVTTNGTAAQTFDFYGTRTWTAITLPVAAGWSHVAFFKNRFVIANSDAANAYAVSYSGQTFASEGGNFATARFTQGARTIIAVPSGARNHFFVSETGSPPWVRVDLPHAVTVQSIEEYNGYLYLFSANFALKCTVTSALAGAPVWVPTGRLPTGAPNRLSIFNGRLAAWNPNTSGIALKREEGNVWDIYATPGALNNSATIRTDLTSGHVFSRPSAITAGTFLRSADLQTWEVIATPPVNRDYAPMAEAQGVYYLSHTAGDFLSEDKGVTWQELGFSKRYVNYDAGLDVPVTGCAEFFLTKAGLGTTSAVEASLDGRNWSTDLEVSAQMLLKTFNPTGAFTGSAAAYAVTSQEGRGYTVTGSSYYNAGVVVSILVKDRYGVTLQSNPAPTPTNTFAIGSGILAAVTTEVRLSEPSPWGFSPSPFYVVPNSSGQSDGTYNIRFYKDELYCLMDAANRFRVRRISAGYSPELFYIPKRYSASYIGWVKAK